MMVRSVEGLVTRGAVARAAGEDRRTIGLRLTEAGEAMRGGILAARADVLTRAWEGVDDRLLAPMVAQMLTTLTDNRRTGDHMCRLCDEGACVNCPVEARACHLEQ